ncbi:MAG: hypothetical protein RhofKO_21660 [Rhodothermales bacterium]
MSRLALSSLVVLVSLSLSACDTSVEDTAPPELSVNAPSIDASLSSAFTVQATAEAESAVAFVSLALYRYNVQADQPEAYLHQFRVEAGENQRTVSMDTVLTLPQGLTLLPIAQAKAQGLDNAQYVLEVATSGSGGGQVNSRLFMAAE